MAISSQACEETDEEIEDLIDEEMEGEVLQMFACGCVDKLRMEPKVGKTIRVKKLKLMTHRSRVSHLKPYVKCQM